MDDILELSHDKITHAIINSNTKIRMNRKILWTKFLFINVLSIDLPESIFINADDSQRNEEQCNKPSDDGTDHHKFTPLELEKIYKVAKEDTRTELIYLLLITTGLRVGGLVNIRVEHVSDIVCHDFVIKDTGRTVEKFNKWFTFVLTERVKELLYQWLKSYKPASASPYLFPGRNGAEHLTTNTIRVIFKKTCKLADVHGKHVHLHSLRHTFAHMLIDSGNNIENVAKIMGHADSKTTSMFYLKQSSSEAAMKANIPWLKNNEKKETIPSFMQCEKDIKKQKKKKKKIRFAAEIQNIHRQKLESISEES